MKIFFWILCVLVLNISYAQESVFDIIPEEQLEDFNVSEPEEEQNDSKPLVDENILNLEKTIENEAEAEVTEKNYYNKAYFRILDKNIAKSSIVSIKINNNLVFNELIVKPRLCFEHNVNGQTESKALIEVRLQDHILNKKIFSGWIFSNNPAISMLEHPKYNINLLKCENSK